MPFVNLTEHTINIHQGIGVDNIPPSGKTLRVSQRLEAVGEIDGVTTFRAFYGDLQMIDNATKTVVGSELPPVVAGTVYIVSGQTLEALKTTNRTDFAAPGELVRDNNGQPCGCLGLKIN